jgi:hypothetical protein
MTPTPRKYYVRVPADFSDTGGCYWQELHDVETLTHAKHYVDRIFGGLKEAEIWASRNGGIIKVVAKKDEEGKWGLVYSSKPETKRANFHYHLSHNVRVSKEDFYKYGFQHEKN